MRRYHRKYERPGDHCSCENYNGWFQAEKDINREFSAMHIIVENTLCELKHFQVLAARFRHNVDDYDTVFRAVVALVNPRIQKRVATNILTAY
jgi:hypothetical protein